MSHQSVRILPVVHVQLVERCRPSGESLSRDLIRRACTTIWSRMNSAARGQLVRELRDEGFVNGDGLDTLTAFAERTFGHEVLARARDYAIASVPPAGQASRSAVAAVMKRYWDSLSLPFQEELVEALKSAKFDGKKGSLAALVAYATNELDKEGKLHSSEWWPGKGAPAVRGGLPGLGKRR